MSSNEKINKDIKMNADEIKECKKQLEKVADAAAASSAAAAKSANNNVAEVTREVQLQQRNAKQLFITNATSESDVKQLLEEILGDEPNLKMIKELTKNNDGGHHSKDERKAPFIVEFENIGEKEQVMNEKTQYFKNNNSNIGINNVRTKLQRQQHRNNNAGKDTTNSSKRTTTKACRYNDKCKRKDCKFIHPKEKKTKEEESDDSGDDTEVEN